MKQGITACVKDKKMILQIDYLEETEEILLKLDSSRNHPLVRFSDRSSLAGEKQISVIRQDYEGDIWFPVIDLEIVPGMYGKAVFTGGDGSGEYTYNAWLWPERRKASGEAVIPSSHLLEWENGFMVTDRSVMVSDFAVFLPVPQPLAITRRCIKELRLLSGQWTGTVTAYYKKEQEYVLIGETVVGERKNVLRKRRERSQEQALNQALNQHTLIDGLEKNLQYLLNSQICSVNNPMDGGFYLFYDLEAKTYRLPSWLWGWGPAIAALLKCSEIPEMANRFGVDLLTAAAERAGAATLQGQVFGDETELDGLSTARWDPNLIMKTGYRQRICGASDSGFLCGYAWIPLYEKTGDKRYLDAALKYAESAVRLVHKYGIPPQDYMPETQGWSAHTLDESGFGVKAFDELYRLTGKQHYREAGKEYIDRHIDKFRRPDGLWERAYFRETDKTEKSIFMTRGLGWAMEGLLCARSLTGEEQYSDQAREMADYLLEKQNQDGSWRFMLNKTIEEAGIDDKGTPLWSLLLYRLYRFTGEKKYRQGAGKALTWCLEHQITEGEEEVIGGLAGANPQSAVVYRPWYPLSCLYTAGFFALAILEELKLQALNIKGNDQ